MTVPFGWQLGDASERPRTGPGWATRAMIRRYWPGLACCLVALFSRGASAQSYRDVSPAVPAPSKPLTQKQPSAPANGTDDRVALQRLNGLVFTAADSGRIGSVAAAAASPGERSNPPAAPTTTPDVTSPARLALPTTASGGGAIQAIGLPLLDPAFLGAFEGDLGKPLTFGRLAQIRQAVIRQYRAKGQPLIDVYVPEQDVSSGKVNIVIAVYRLGRVIASGNRHFSSPLLVGEMPLTVGKPISQQALSTGITQLNANPYRQVEVIYTPGEADNTTNVVLQTQDRLPFRVDAGYDNSGVPDLGRDRFFAGFDYGNLFGLDQQIAYQFTASNDLLGGNPAIEGRPDRARYLGHSLNYVAPLRWGDRIELFGVFAQTTPRLPDSYGQTGTSAQLSLRYDLHLPDWGDRRQQWQFGYDYKRSNNDLEFGGFQVFNSNTHIHQFLLSYDVTRAQARGQTHWNASLYLSPGHLDGQNSNNDFESARAGASPRYTYLQLSSDRDWTFGPGFALSGKALLQWTPNTLLPSEELGLGGEQSVRGYDPYVALGDRGWNFQTELRTPPLTVANLAWQPFVFFDGGHAWNRIDQPNEVSAGSLLSVGAGFRFQLSRYVNFRGTYGFPLRAAVPNGSKAPLAMMYLLIGS